MIRQLTCILLTALFTCSSGFAENADSLRVVAYNIHHGEGMDGQINLDRIAEVIAAQQPDLVALQEVDVKCRRSGNVDMAKKLAELLGMECRFGKTINLQNGKYGNAVLSRLPILDTQVHPLPRSQEPRVAFEVVVEFNGAPLSFVSLHLERNSEGQRNAQTEALNDLFFSREQPVILAGDFNAARWSAPMKVLDAAGWRVLEKNDGKDIRTFHGEKKRADSATKERTEIDYLVTRGLEVESFRHGVVPELTASDHRPVYGVFHLTESQPSVQRPVLLPKPTALTILSGESFGFTPETKIIYQDVSSADTAEYLKERILSFSGISLDAGQGNPTRDAVNLVLDPALEGEVGEDSLAKHEAEPEWLKDAKLGIYFHWGPYSVPAHGTGWYARQMHMKSHRDNRFHEENFGPVGEFGYHDFVPKFTGEHFDAEEWADLFQKAGARFGGPVSEHHDGFAMWDWDITPWNAKDRGPRQDILGEMFKAFRKRGIKTIATFHHSFNLQRQREKPKNWKRSPDSYFPYNSEFATSSEDPDLRLLYGNVPEEEWLEEIWLGKLEEVINKYQPDIMWFDSWMDRIPESYRQRFSAYYLNAAKGWGKEVVIVRKQKDLPLTFSINDHERAREPKALPVLWMTDDTPGSGGHWSYATRMKARP